jgi:hypothetical protein
MLGILGILFAIAAFICQIFVVVKMFQTAGPIQGIIGLICGIWSFIWGWMNAGKLGIKNIMLAWTVLIVLCIIFNIAGGGFSYKYGY